MKRSHLLLSSMIAITALASCGGASTNSDETTGGDSATVVTDSMSLPEATGTLVATANLMSTADSTQQIGTAKFYQLDSTQIRMDLVIDDKARADSNVAVHFHEHGDCGDKGNNTHGHWNPTKENHGEWGSAAYHSGDIGNIQLDNSGHATKSVTTDRWSITDGATNNIIGKGIIVHGGTDDYKTQPTGNSGPRSGCGVIMKQ
ncbi:superoxide dismutase family protein [Niabella ginsengisoli]|uniref:Superoxide dismutase [Cu-Zn] n=1 Tax=Niabella ginsengisoli TaxID=522298 RepID=A0ABS9SGX7_9BACT|nr:superoxide dismutase family protein [Niabella ginsengisoli]MCH5597576.1 superoxide dismutase family protein [Niabella ginsengisoli]